MFLGCILIGLTTVINAAGVRLLARINNVGVFAELLGVTLLIVLLAAQVRRGPSILFETQTAVGGRPGLLPGAISAAAVMASYVLYGFDTAGTLAEETHDAAPASTLGDSPGNWPRRVAGGLLIFFGLLAVSDPGQPELGEITGGLPLIVKQSSGPGWACLPRRCDLRCVRMCPGRTGRHGAADLRDGPRQQPPLCARAGRVQAETQRSDRPSPGRRRGGDDPAHQREYTRIIETLCSVAIVWANLAYLMVSFPLLLMRLRGWPSKEAVEVGATVAAGSGLPFALGRDGDSASM